MQLNVELILASRSPRRRHLLEQMGLTFTIRPSEAEETIQPGETPADVVRRLALLKAGDIAAGRPDALTLGADTIVVLGDAILGKPSGTAEAAAMLRRLGGTTNTVYTGIALLHPRTGRTVTAYEATRVTFGPMTDEEIDAYVATGSPMDKAGAYGIQDDLGALFISRIEGDYYNVVGLPIHRLYRVLRTEFTDLVDTIV
jgi:septum formation protein